jgi:hypothetical protein
MRQCEARIQCRLIGNVHMSSEKFLLAINTSIEGTEKSDLFLIGVYDTLEEAYAKAEGSAAYLFKPEMKYFSVFRLSDDSLVNDVTRGNLQIVFHDLLGFDGLPQ